PSRIAPRYALGSTETNGTSLVASRTASGSTPVACGSSVPRWPTRRVPNQRRAASTTSCDVPPAGLPTTRKPLGPGPSSARRRPLRLIAQLAEQRQRADGQLEAGGVAAAQPPPA